MPTILILWLANLAVIHPFHVSVFDIEYKSDKKAEQEKGQENEENVEIEENEEVDMAQDALNERLRGLE